MDRWCRKTNNISVLRYLGCRSVFPPWTVNVNHKTHQQQLCIEHAVTGYYDKRAILYSKVCKKIYLKVYVIVTIVQLWFIQYVCTFKQFMKFVPLYLVLSNLFDGLNRGRCRLFTWRKRCSHTVIIKREVLTPTLHV